MRFTILGLALGLAAATYFLAPFRTNLLILGTDRRPGGDSASRTDTILLATLLPTRPYVGILSIPRDLWVQVPGFGPNRINAAYFLAEAQQAGTGAAAAVETVRTNFGVDVHAYVAIEFAGFVRFVDALGGVTVELERALGGYPAGRHHLDGTQALAFARDRTGDDFFRMQNGQALLRALLRALASPASWPRWPLAVPALLTTVQTDLPVLLWPRLTLALLRAGPSGVDARVIGREMVQGFTTEGGAQVLAPDWSRINPVLLEMFGQ
jgi:LCP family protein required for cell wall assembly